MPESDIYIYIDLNLIITSPADFWGPLLAINRNSPDDFFRQISFCCYWFKKFVVINIDGLVQDCSISIAKAMEILQSCINHVNSNLATYLTLIRYLSHEPWRCYLKCDLMASEGLTTGVPFHQMPTRIPFQYPIRHLIMGSCEVSKQRDW